MGMTKKPKGLTLNIDTEQTGQDIDEQVIITPNLMNLNSLTGGGMGLSPQMGSNNAMRNMQGMGMMNNGQYGQSNPGNKPWGWEQ